MGPNGGRRTAVYFTVPADSDYGLTVAAAGGTQITADLDLTYDLKGQTLTVPLVPLSVVVTDAFSGNPVANADVSTASSSCGDQTAQVLPGVRKAASQAETSSPPRPTAPARPPRPCWPARP